MEQAFRDKIMPTQWFWCILNNLDKFDSKPKLMLDLIDKFKKIEDHKVLSTLREIIEAIERGYYELGKFPDIAWLKLNFKGNIAIIISNDEFSMQMYDSLDRYLDQEFLKQEVNKRIVETDNLDLDEVRSLTKFMSNYTDRSSEIPKATKDKIKNLYTEYKQNFRGLRTWIKPIDDVIGVMGYKSISVFAAPSGHGKSTFAISTAYYAAMNGAHVDYLSFEIPFDHAWFNIASMYSEDKDVKIKASDLKECSTTEEQDEAYKRYINEIMAHIEKAGGYLNIIDQSKGSAPTFSELCSKLEAMADERKRPADLIVVDNVDNLAILQDTERNEQTKVNNYIIALDSFCKEYYSGSGTTILLLSQVNRPAMKKLYTSEGQDSDKKVKIDVTCIQKYNALYEKATCVLVGYSDEISRSQGTMKVYPVKLRNRGIPEKPITVSVNFAFSKVRGEFALDEICGIGEKGEEKASKVIDTWIKEQVVGISQEEEEELDELLSEDL